ncbi:facilitated trehalose transporter Tret1-like [Coccinella septempunctata]|uniref:facilitated trehalose transporter Tret1-like n=1 Tax=Coccinella septempunctata TaxID=41139 RepID=UPI001D069022|nr:facilitated trehalose transporter Tret1-like [Coccinella septempunctata]
MKTVFSRRTYEYFSDFFGQQYFKFIVCVAHTFFFGIAVAMSWTSPVLSKLSETEDNPLGEPITPDQSDLIGSLLYIGAAIGPILFIPAAEYFGRKNVLLILSVIPPLTYGTFAFAKVVELYYVCRILQGVYMGGSLSVQPVYVAEILSNEERDFYMSLGTMFGFSGLLVVYAVGPFVPLIYFNGFFAIFGVVVVILLAFGCPETPFFMMKTKGKDATNELLMLIRQKFDNKEADEIQSTINNEVRDSFFDLFSSTKNIKLFIMATMPLLLQQFSGISILLTYSQPIFDKTNISITPAVCSLIVACFQVSTSFLTPALLKSGRFSLRILLLFCLTGMAICNVILALYFFAFNDTPSLNWLPLLGFVLFVPFYNCGIDPIPWMLLGQIYPRSLSSVGSALSTSIYFLATFPSLFLFSKIETGFLFSYCAFFCCLGIPYVLFIFSEPKNV